MGIFGAAGKVEVRSELSDWTRQRLADSLDWFGEHLPIPRDDEIDKRAIFWFEPRSTVVREIWDLVSILRDVEIPIGLRRTNMPGRIVYRDKFQIAAIPYSHGRRDRNRRWPRLEA